MRKLLLVSFNIRGRGNGGLAIFFRTSTCSKISRIQLPSDRLLGTTVSVCSQEIALLTLLALANALTRMVVLVGLITLQPVNLLSVLSINALVLCLQAVVPLTKSLIFPSNSVNTTLPNVSFTSANCDTSAQAINWDAVNPEQTIHYLQIISYRYSLLPVLGILY
jgi:hypothetical protein